MPIGTCIADSSPNIMVIFSLQQMTCYFQCLYVFTFSNGKWRCLETPLSQPLRKIWFCWTGNWHLKSNWRQRLIYSVILYLELLNENFYCFIFEKLFRWSVLSMWYIYMRVCVYNIYSHFFWCFCLKRTDFYFRNFCSYSVFPFNVL
jgi:hypothetical protein